MIYTKDSILQVQAHLKRAGVDHVPYSEMLKPQRHLLGLFPAITTSLGAIGIPCGYIGVYDKHPMFRSSCDDIDRLHENNGLGIVYAGFNPTSVDIMKHTYNECWYFGVDTGTNLKATRQDVIDHLRLIAEFLNKKDRESRHANTHN